MFIDKYKKEDGCYYDENGDFYEDAKSFIQTKIFGFCECGVPDASLMFVARVLKQVDNLKQLVWEKKQTYEEWVADNKKLFGSGEAEYFMWYFLDREGFTEHGGSVPGWLTDKGIELLNDLTELLNLENKPI